MKAQLENFEKENLKTRASIKNFTKLDGFSSQNLHKSQILPFSYDSATDPIRVFDSVGQIEERYELDKKGTMSNKRLSQYNISTLLSRSAALNTMTELNIMMPKEIDIQRLRMQKIKIERGKLPQRNRTIDTNVDKSVFESHKWS